MFPPPWIFFLFGFILCACDRGGDVSSIRNLQSQGETVVCFGDSLTEGFGAGRGEDYPSILASHLGMRVLNAGERGDTTTAALGRLERDVLQHNPRLVIVLLGGNDFLRQVPLEETKKNLEEIVRRIQQQGAMVAIAGLRLGLFTDEYGRIYQEIARKYRALYIPEVLKGILSNSQLKSDSIHPNGAGYRLVAERVFRSVRPLLEEAGRQKAANASGLSDVR